MGEAGKVGEVGDIKERLPAGEAPHLAEDVHQVVHPSVGDLTGV